MPLVNGNTSFDTLLFKDGACPRSRSERFEIALRSGEGKPRHYETFVTA